MAEYNPDSWVIIKLSDLKNNTHHYRVLCSWSGSYTWGSSWKISSGIEDVIDEGEYWRMPQTSGSTYLLHKSCERMSGMMYGIFEKYSSQNDADLSMTQVKIEDLLKVFNS